MRNRFIIRFKKRGLILGIHFIVAAALIFLPYRSSINLFVQIGLMGLAVLSFVLEPVSVFSSMLFFNILPTTFNSAIQASEAEYYLGYRMAWMVLLGLAVFYILIHHKKISIGRYSGICMGFGVYILITNLWAWDTTYYSDTFYLLVGIYVALPILLNTHEDTRFVWESFILAGLLLAANMLAYTLTVGLIQETGAAKDSNYLSLVTMIVLTMSIAYLYQFWRDVSKWLRIVISISAIMSVFLLISYASRTAFLVLLAYFLIIALYLIKNNKKALIILTFLGIVTIWLIYVQGVYDYLARTFFEENFETGNGRTVLWAQYWQEYLRESVLLKIFGRGFHVFRGNFLGFRFFAHNSYLSILIDFGFIGGILFVANAFLSMLSMWKNEYRFLSISMFVNCAFLFALDGYQNAMCAEYLAFCACCASCAASRKNVKGDHYETSAVRDPWT